MRNNWFSSLFGLIFLASSLYAVSLEDFPFFKKINSNLTPHQLNSFLVGDDIWEHLNDTQANIRLFDSHNHEIPFVLKAQKTFDFIYEPARSSSKLISMIPQENNAIELIFEMESPNPIDVVTISTSIKNFEKTIMIYGSYTQDQWQFLTQDTIFDYSAVIDHQKLSVELPKSDFKYFKIKLDNVSEDLQSPFVLLSEKQGLTDKKIIEYHKAIYKEIFKVDQVLFYYTQPTLNANSELEIDRVTPSWNVSSFSDNGIHKTELLVDTSGRPFLSGVITTATKVYKRPLIVEIFNSELAQWETVSTHTLTTDQNNKSFLSFNHLTADQLRIVIDNEDNKPAEIIDFQLYKASYQLVFPLEKQTDIAVYFGGSLSKVPTYDIQKYAQTREFLLDLSVVPVYELKHSVQRNSRYLPQSIDHRIQVDGFFLTFSLVLLVIVLVIVLVFVSKKVSTSSEEIY